MNKQNQMPQENRRTFWDRLRFDKTAKDVCILCVIGLCLAFAAWRTFYSKDNPKTTDRTVSVTEQKVEHLLGQIEGVGEANVMIYEKEDKVESVVVVCDGANRLDVVMDIREAVAAAIGAEEKAIKIYLKKD